MIEQLRFSSTHLTIFAAQLLDERVNVAERARCANRLAHAERGDERDDVGVLKSKSRYYAEW